MQDSYTTLLVIIISNLGYFQKLPKIVKKKMRRSPEFCTVGIGMAENKRRKAILLS
jgi:hypothetical protein